MNSFWPDVLLDCLVCIRNHVVYLLGSIPKQKKMPNSAYVQILEYFSLTMTFCGGNKGWLKPGFRPALHCIALPPGVNNTSPPRRMRVIAKQLHRIRETAMHNVIYTRWQCPFCLDRPHFLIPFSTLILSPSLYFAPTPYFFEAFLKWWKKNCELLT